MNDLNERIDVRVPSALKAAILKEASERCVDASDIVRWALLDRYAEQIAAERLQAEEQQAQAA